MLLLRILIILFAILTFWKPAGAQELSEEQLNEIRSYVSDRVAEDEPGERLSWALL